MIDFEKSQEIFRKLQEFSLQEKLVLQIKKDFKRSNVSLVIPISSSNKDILQLLQEKLYVLLLEKFDDYLNLLYVIDISENSLKKVETNDIVEVSKEVAFLVFEREFQKVWFKNQYR